MRVQKSVNFIDAMIIIMNGNKAIQIIKKKKKPETKSDKVRKRFTMSRSTHL